MLCDFDAMRRCSLELSQRILRWAHAEIDEMRMKLARKTQKMHAEVDEMSNTKDF